MYTQMQTAQPLEQVFVHSLMTHAHNYYLQLHAADDIVLSMFEKQFSVFWLVAHCTFKLYFSKASPQFHISKYIVPHSD